MVLRQADYAVYKEIEVGRDLVARDEKPSESGTSTQLLLSCTGNVYAIWFAPASKTFQLTHLRLFVTPNDALSIDLTLSRSNTAHWGNKVGGGQG